jgi:hypothetical protein
MKTGRAAGQPDRTSGPRRLDTREETARELADSFRLENCVVRERLAGILSASARQPS